MIDIKLRVIATDAKTVVVEVETLGVENTDLRSYIMPPEQAVGVANAILQAAEKCGLEIRVDSAPVVTDMQRMALVKRTELIINSMSGNKVDRIAVHVVDSILSEIL